MSQGFLKVKGTSIVNGGGKKITLRGTNFGGWLMMEGYFMHAPNTAEQLLKKQWKKVLGEKSLRDFEFQFRSNFITEADMKQVAAWGFNSLRLPFNYRLLEDGGLVFIDKAISWARKYGVYLILDLHGAPGAQNHDWHSDSLGKAELWTKKAYRQQTYKIWEFLSDRYKDEPMIAGYDVLNEAVMGDTKLLNEFYTQVIKSIRQSDKNHILFIEGNRWAQVIDVLADFNDDNLVFGIHYYEPPEFSFNLVPHLKHPLKGYGPADIRKRMEGYARFAKQKNRPVHVGEFGVNYRQGLFNEDQYVADVLKAFKEFGFHWNYWTYKSIKHFMHPDGILSYYPNPPWVNRPGPKYGWDNWVALWHKHRKEMIASWRTEAVSLTDRILKVLKAS